MCDYSLHAVQSRPAKVGEKLVSTSFRMASTSGFAPRDNREIAVCLLPGTELAFEEEVSTIIGGFGPKKPDSGWRAFARSTCISPITTMTHSNSLTEKWCW